MTKGMVSIANKPILEHLISALKEVGIQDIVMVVGYKKEKILRHFGDGGDFGVNIQFVMQKKPLGTGDALRQARHLLDSDFIVLPGDNYIESSTLEPLLRAEIEPNSILFAESTALSKYGIVSIRDGYITDIRVNTSVSEEGGSFTSHNVITHAIRAYEGCSNTTGLIFTCICRFQPEIFSHMEEIAGKERNNITGLIKHMIDNEARIGAVRASIWKDAIFPWDLLQLNDQALLGFEVEKSGVIKDGATLVGDISIGKGTLIHPNSYIKGPVVIGAGCEIGPNSVIYPSTSIGDNVTVDCFTKISNSILMNDVSVGQGCLIEDSVLGEGVNFGSRASTLTIPINTIGKGRMGDSTRIGCIVGQDCDISHGAVINGGLILGSSSHIDPLVNVVSDVPDSTRMVR